MSVDDIESNEDEGYTRKHSSTLISIGWAVFFGVVILIVYSCTADTVPQGFRRAATGIAVAGAAMMLGGLIGFLFGIPRRLQREPDPKRDDSGRADAPDSGLSLYEGNTNLEQISDWLTKILVGVGLVQVSDIIGALDGYGTKVATALGDNSAGSFAVAVIIYFFISGFLLGYLWARLFLGRALTEAESRVRLQKRLNKLERQIHADASALTLAGAQLSGDAGETPSMEALQQAMNAASSSTRAHLFFQAENNRWKYWKDEKEKMERSIPIFQALVVASPDDKYHRTLSNLAYALKDKRDHDWDAAEGYLTRAMISRGPASTEGFAAYEANRAICRIMMGDRFTQRFGSKKEAVEAVLDDLRTAASDEWVARWLEEDETVMQWCKENSVTFPA